jgi:hypothetical protein
MKKIIIKRKKAENEKEIEKETQQTRKKRKK